MDGLFQHRNLSTGIGRVSNWWILAGPISCIFMWFTAKILPNNEFLPQALGLAPLPAWEILDSPVLGFCQPYRHVQTPSPVAMTPIFHCPHHHNWVQSPLHTDTKITKIMSLRHSMSFSNTSIILIFFQKETA